MRKKINYSKRGVAMIELIFSLVIMGIVLLSAPLLIFQAVQSNSVSLQQEAIAAVASHTNILLSKDWDEENTDKSNGSATILQTSSSSSTIFDINITNPRAGLSSVPARRIRDNMGNIHMASAIGDDSGDRDDIDDYHDKDNNISIYLSEATTALTGDYVDINLNIHTMVNYIEDAPTGNLDITSNAPNMNDASTLGVGKTSNIKYISVLLTSNSDIKELNKTIALKAFSCNIGTTLINGEDKL